MSKITFRADDDLVRQLEGFDASKSEVMREALREFLGAADGTSISCRAADADSLDDGIAERVDELVEQRLDEALGSRKPPDINVNIALEGESGDATAERGANRKTTAPDRENAGSEERKTCGQCGETLSPSAVYCNNCGEKAARRVFCDCGDELRSDWAFCPSCGRRTPAADVLDST
jgi:predicted transcriptional regulator